jgi:predicted phage terminase large subunit-like protein
MSFRPKKNLKRPLSAKEIDLWKTLEALAGADSILDWIPLMSPNYEKPKHLIRLLEVISRMQFEPVYAWCSVPPRFSKTESILHSVVWRLMQNPTTEIAYCTYEANLAYSKSRKMRELAEKCGIRLKRGASGVQEWWTEAGGRVIATGIGGPITGKGCNWLIIDDALKNREEAESVVIRQKQWDWLTSTAMTRVEPGGSILVNATRWHDDDLIGRIQEEFCRNLEDDAGIHWTGIHMPAVYEENGVERSLWPTRWPMSELKKKRRLVGEYDWASLYQGQPRPKGGRLFKTASRYDSPMIVETDTPYKIIIGADPAATMKTTADYSVAVVMAVSGEFNTLDFRADILEVYRGQVEIPTFVARLRDLAVKWGAPIAVEAVAGFKAIPQMLKNLDKRLRIIEAPALGDKFTRALPASACWNDGRLRVPHNADWVNDFLAEVEKFTGVKDAKDDQVDALAHAYNCAQMLMPQMKNNTPKAIRSGLPFG